MTLKLMLRSATHVGPYITKYSDRILKSHPKLLIICWIDNFPGSQFIAELIRVSVTTQLEEFIPIHLSV